MHRLRFHLFYPHNLFYVLDSLSGWSIHTRSYLREIYPSLYKNIKKYLPSYVKMREKYGWKNNIEIYFLEPSLSKVRKKMEKKIPKRDVELVFKILRIVDKDFKKIWKEKKKMLDDYISILEKIWNKLGEKAVSEIEDFLDLPCPSVIDVYVIFRSRGSGGGANIGKKGLTLEMGDVQRFPASCMETIIHELMHFCEIKNDKPTSGRLTELGIKESKKEEENEVSMVKEAIFGLLVPHGFLSEKIGLSGFLVLPPAEPRRIWERRKNRYKVLLKNVVSDYYKNKKKRNYWEDFLPQVVRKVKQREKKRGK